MAAYWKNYLLPRRATMLALVKIARDHGLVRDDWDPELLLDLVSGAIIHHLLVRPGKRSRSEMRSYLSRVVRELGQPTQKPKG